MCQAHASQIDDPASVDAYPAELLRQWKTAQHDEFKRVQTGWALGKEAVQQIREGAHASSIVISNSTIDLGGQGGQAPGAGGGGGGAIGPGAKGGKGGKGGDQFIDEGPYTKPWVPPLQVPAPPLGPDGKTPGAGGGGGGAMGPDAVGGDGGDGGDAIFATIDLEALIADGFTGTADVQVGKGGKGARLPGELPGRGEDTVITFRRADGTIIKELRAKAGASAGPKLPDGYREISTSDLSGGLRVTTLMPVGTGEIRDCLFSTLSSDWRLVPVDQLPLDFVVSVFCSMRWRDLKIPPGGLGFHLFLCDPKGIRIAQQPLTLPADFPNDGYSNWLVPIGSAIEEAGEYSLQVVSGEFLLTETLIRVVAGSKKI